MSAGTTLQSSDAVVENTAARRTAPERTTADNPATAHAALLLREDDGADRAFLAELRADPHVMVIDRSEHVRHEVRALRPALDRTALTESPRWAWYPWRRTVVAVPGPLSFRRLRSDRNRNKITAAEQDGYRALTIGIVGMSVGHSIAHTLALEGLCGRLRVADHDTIDLSNLNRIPATVLDVGINKSIVAARRIAELDPYLPVDVFPCGVTEENITVFFDGLDLLVEECDSLDMKVRLREEARARGIPVIMETSDRGLLDVERFDREPDRALIHGLLGDLRSHELRNLSTHDKAPHVMRILEADALSARMAASMVEIDRTVSTWPQLGGDVQLGGATAAAAIRRFGRGEDLSSGRTRIDLESALDDLRDDIAGPSSPNPPARQDTLSRSVPDRPGDAVVHAIRLAPSGGNSQPWTLRVAHDRIDVFLARDRTSAMDVAFRGSYVSIGAARFNAEIAAARHSRRARITDFPEGTDSDLVLSIELGEGAADPELAELYPAMIDRMTNRRFGRQRPLGAGIVTALESDAASAGARLHLIRDRQRMAAMADLLAESDRLRYLTPELHRQMMDELRWPDQPAGAGIDVATLGLDVSDLAKLQVARRVEVMAQLAAWGTGRALGDSTRDRVNASSAVAILTVRGDSPHDYLRGGRALEQFWIRAGRSGLGVHPVSPVFLFARSDRDRSSLSADFGDELGRLHHRFGRIVGLQNCEVPVLVLRLSHDPPPTARSERLDCSAVLEGTDISIERKRSAS